MKKIILLSLLFFLCIAAYSQNWSDVVYLKNGSIIKGTIIEQVPNVSLKIQSGENVFVYPMDDVEKIVKEQIQNKNNLSKSVEQKTNYPNKGYRGFGEIGIGAGKDGVNAKFSHIAYSSVHGCQFNSILFVGGGVGLYDYYNNKDNIIMVPLFGIVRLDMVKNAISPFLDMRLGYSFGDNDGVYYSPSFGIRFSTIHISAGYLLQGYNYETMANRSVGEGIGYVKSYFVRFVVDWGSRHKYVSVND